MREYEYAETIRKRATPDEFHPSKLGVYCNKCRKSHPNCVCRRPELFAREVR